MSCVGPEGAQMLIDNDRYIVDLVLNALFGKPQYPPGISNQRRERLESMRVVMGKSVLPVMGMVRTFASRFPEEAVRAKVTPEWLMRRGSQSFPEVAEVWRRNGDKGYAWLSRQSEEIVQYVTGRLVWDGQKAVTLGKGDR